MHCPGWKGLLLHRNDQGQTHAPAPPHIGEVVAEEDFRKHAQKITVWINLRINPILHSQENWWVGSWQYEMYVRDQLQDFCEMSSEISDFCSSVCFKFPTVALKTQQLRNNQETRINDISAISTQWKHLQGMGHVSVLNFQSLLQMESLLCSISTKTIPRVTRDQLVWSKQLRIEEISSTTYEVQEKVSGSDLTVPDIPIIRCWGLMISQTGKSIHIPLSVSTMVSLSSKLSTFWTEILAPLHAMLCVASFSNFRFMFGGDGFLIYLHWVLSTRYATPRLCSAAPTTFEVIEQDKDGQRKFGTHNVKTVWDSSLHAPHHIGFVTWDFKMPNFEDPRDRRADKCWQHCPCHSRRETSNMRHPSSSHSFGIVFLHLDEIKLGSSCWDPELTESNSP